MIVIVCGGREWRDEVYVHARLNVIHACTPITEVHEGGARGVDTMARVWAERKNIPCFEYRLEQYGDLAALIWEMLRIANPDAIIAFSAGAGDGVHSLTSIAAARDIHIINLQKGMTS